MAKAVSQGAKVADRRRPARGLQPGLVRRCRRFSVGCTPDMEILNNESFGPVAPICQVKSFDEAIGSPTVRATAWADIYTSDLNESDARGERARVRHGLGQRAAARQRRRPFGGRKMSGTGRQLGAEGPRQFRHTKFVMIDPAASAQDFWWFPYKDKESFPGSRK